jgi:hypothetical protein
MWTIVFYTDHRGKQPVIDFIASLPINEQAKLRNTLRLLLEFGTRLGMPHARPVKNKIW